MSTDRKQYWRDYYSANREAILASRKAAYAALTPYDRARRSSLEKARRPIDTYARKLGVTASEARRIMLEQDKKARAEASFQAEATAG